MSTTAKQWVSLVLAIFCTWVFYSLGSGFFGTIFLILALICVAGLLWTPFKKHMRTEIARQQAAQEQPRIQEPGMSSPNVQGRIYRPRPLDRQE